MKPIPAEQIVEQLSEDVQDMLVREAYIRQRREAYTRMLAEKRAEEAAQKQAKPSWLFRKGAKEGGDAPGQLGQEIAALEGALASCDTILESCRKIITAELENHFTRTFEAYRNAVAAQKLVPEWESAIGLYRSALKRFITALGIVRNQMASGYDRKTGTFSKGAQEAFVAMATAARMLEAEAQPPNQIARRHRELLGIATAADDRTFSEVASSEISKRVAMIKTGTLEIAQAAIGELLAGSEKNYENLDAMIGDAARIRSAVEAERVQLLEMPLAELRAMADGSVDPAQAEAVWSSMVARFIKFTGG